jgi:hypothetical protein
MIQLQSCGAMDAAGPVDGANGRAAHEVLGNRFAISTAPTAHSSRLSTTDTKSQSTRPPNRGRFIGPSKAIKRDEAGRIAGERLCRGGNRVRNRVPIAAVLEYRDQRRSITWIGPENEAVLCGCSGVAPLGRQRAGSDMARPVHGISPLSLSNTGDQLRRSDLAGLRQLHRLVRRPRFQHACCCQSLRRVH